MKTQIIPLLHFVKWILELREILLDIYRLTETVMYNFIMQSRARPYQHCRRRWYTFGWTDINVDNERSNKERRPKNIYYSTIFYLWLRCLEELSTSGCQSLVTVRKISEWFELKTGVRKHPNTVVINFLPKRFKNGFKEPKLEVKSSHKLVFT